MGTSYNLELDIETYVHLKPEKSMNRTSKFYFLTKIPKKEVKGRPIINGNGWPTEKISAFVDDHIKGFVKKPLIRQRHSRFHQETG